jgi:photosystem II stability/assembly factor-like uncharacterized protein
MQTLPNTPRLRGIRHLPIYLWLVLITMFSMAQTVTAQQVPFGRSGWKWDSRQVTENPIRAVSFWTADSGYVMTDTELLLTSDGGRTFAPRTYTPPPLGFNVQYQSICGNSFWFSSKRGVVVTYSPGSFFIYSFTTYATTDGGLTWSTLLNTGGSGSSAAPYAGAPLIRTNASLTMAAVGAIGGGQLFTSDGGATWFYPDSIITPNSAGPQGGLEEIYFGPGNTILLSTRREIYRSVNNGRVFRRVYESPYTDNVMGARDFSFTGNSGVAFVLPTSLFYSVAVLTRDGGRTWRDSLDYNGGTTNAANLSQTVPFGPNLTITKSIGFGLGASSTVYNPFLGYSRIIQYPAFNNPYGGNIFSIFHPFSVRPGTMQAVLADGFGLLYAMDTSLVARYINRPNTQSRSFQNGLPARRNIQIAASSNWVTTDGGVTFDSIKPFSPVCQSPSSGIAFVRGRTAFGYCENRFYRSTSGGRTWSLAGSVGGANDLVGAFYMVDSLVGFVYLKGNNLFPTAPFYRTNNGCRSWTLVGTSNKSTEISFATPLVGFKTKITSSQPLPIERTADGGQTWSPDPNNPNTTVPVFVTPSAGFLGALITLDTGKTFRQIDPSGTFGQPFWIDNRTIVAFQTTYTPTRAEARLMVTKNYGRSWTPISGALPKNINTSDLLYMGGTRFRIFGSAGLQYDLDATGFLDIDEDLIGGTVREEVDRNCATRDTNERGLPGRIIVAEPQMSYAYTDDNGYYELGLGGDSVRVSQLILDPLQRTYATKVCDTLYRIRLRPGVVDTNFHADFANRINSCAQLEARPWPVRARSCSTAVHGITIWNRGLGTARDTVFVRVFFPSQFRLDSATLPYRFNPSDSSYSFAYIGEFKGGTSVQLLLYSHTACGIPLQDFCLRVVTEYAGLSCSDARLGDGSMIGAGVACQGDTSIISIYNGGEAMNLDRQIRLYLDSSLVRTFNYRLADRESLRIGVAANGGILRLEADQDIANPALSTVTAQVRCLNGRPVPVVNNWFSDAAFSVNDRVTCGQITNSYDPNDKQVSPSGRGPRGIVAPGTELTYTIRFQNTGTDTAFVVQVYDTLDITHLDLSTLRIGATSHQGGTFTLSGQGKPVLHWRWDRILLPDSNRNKEGSNGFVSFAIRSKANTALGTEVRNNAGIYFDFNPVIITNTTLTTLGEVPVEPGLVDTINVITSARTTRTSQLRAYPSPTRDQISVDAPAPGQMIIMSLQGQIVAERKISTLGTETINVKDIPAGTYLIQLTTEKAVYVSRIVKL